MNLNKVILKKTKLKNNNKMSINNKITKIEILYRK